MIDRTKIAVLTPLYNEAEVLANFLDRLKKQGLPLLVVDDGSTDGSLAIAREKGVEVLSLRVNQGKGNALRLGFRRLCNRGFEWVVILDSDGQHFPEEIPHFITMAETGEFGLLNGNRFSRPNGMPLLRLVTNHVMSLITSLLAGQRIWDSQCGFKMLSAKLLRASQLRSQYFEIEAELLLEAARKGSKIGYVPITSSYGAETSHIRPLKDTIRFLQFIFRWAFRNGRREMISEKPESRRGAPAPGRDRV